MEWYQLGINEKMAAITNSLFYNTVKDKVAHIISNEALVEAIASVEQCPAFYSNGDQEIHASFDSQFIWCETEQGHGFWHGLHKATL
jgi:hypothetical protein